MKKKRIRILSDMDSNVQILTDGTTIVQCTLFGHWEPDELLNLNKTFESWCKMADEGRAGFSYKKA